MWQDYVFTIGLIVFDVALIPAVLSTQKPPLITSVPTGFFQFVFAGVFVTLGLWFSAIASVVNGLLWSTLAIQKYQQKYQNTKFEQRRSK